MDIFLQLHGIFIIIYTTRRSELAKIVLIAIDGKCYGILYATRNNMVSVNFDYVDFFIRMYKLSSSRWDFWLHVFSRRTHRRTRLGCEVFALLCFFNIVVWSYTLKLSGEVKRFHSRALSRRTTKLKKDNHRVLVEVVSRVFAAVNAKVIWHPNHRFPLPFSLSFFLVIEKITRENAIFERCAPLRAVSSTVS